MIPISEECINAIAKIISEDPDILNEVIEDPRKTQEIDISPEELKKRYKKYASTTKTVEMPQLQDPTQNPYKQYELSRKRIQNQLYEAGELVKSLEQAYKSIAEYIKLTENEKLATRLIKLREMIGPTILDLNMRIDRVTKSSARGLEVASTPEETMEELFGD